MYKFRRLMSILPRYVVLGLWSLFIIFIIGWIIVASFSSTRDIFTNQLLGSGFSLDSYRKALFTNNGLVNLLNSVLYSIPSSLATVFISASAAYALTRYVFRGNNLIQRLMVIGMAIPSIMIIMPLYSIVGQLDLINSRWVLIVLYTATSVPFTTYFLMAFFNSISTTYEESAAIDGCGPIKTFWKIIFPLAQPAVVTVFIFNFISKWNEYFMALIFANKPSLRPIGVGLYATVQSMVVTGDWAGMFASVVIVFAPTLIIFIFLSNRIVSGITSGGIKG